MKKKTWKFLIAFTILVLSPLICMGIVNNVKVIDYDYKKIEANVVDSYQTRDKYSIKVSYTVAGKNYEGRLTTNKSYHDKITIYYHVSSPKHILLSNKKDLSSNIKKNIYRVFGVSIFIYSVAIVIIFRNEIIYLMQKKDSSKEEVDLISGSDNENIHTMSHIESKQEENEFIVVGKIIQVIKKENYYIVVIEYEYNDDVYGFEVNLFGEEIDDLVMTKGPIDIDVYIDLEQPDAARIDEENLRNLLK